MGAFEVMTYFIVISTVSSGYTSQKITKCEQTQINKFSDIDMGR